MSEEERFNSLLSKDPSPGIKNRVLKTGRDFLIPGWVFNSKEEYVKVTYKNIKRRTPEKYGITGQIIYDILVLGLININNRPRCPICGDLCTYECFSRGYSATCGKKICIKESIKNKVKYLWGDSEYRTKQTDSHKAWSEKEENKEKMRINSLNAWKDEDYRARQTIAHKNLASFDKNKEKMSNITKEMWKNDKYRKKQVESHKNWVINNPDKILCGKKGVIICSKSSLGEITYDSQWEKDFIGLCNSLDSVITIERSSIKIPYIFNGETKYYFPDFIIKTENEVLLVEIKCDWLLKTDEKTKIKTETGEAFVKENKVYSRYLVLTSKELYINPSCTILNIEKLKELIENKS